MSDEFNDDLDKTSILTSDTFKIRLAEAGEAPPCLVLLVGPVNSVGRQWPIESPEKVIGRSIDVPISVEDRSVSKAHAKLLLAAGEVAIMDLESTNRTMVNEQPVEPLKPVKLKNNDKIQMGNIIFKFLEKGNIETVSAAQTFDRGLVDSLTKINNKGALMAKGPENFNKASMLGLPFSLMTFDIDHFKHVNDTYGHDAGDYILIEMVRVIKDRMIRENDFFARSGGEEFCLLLLGSHLLQSTEIAERIRITVENFKFEFNGTLIPITISIGVSCKTEHDTGWEDIFKRADEALYDSKNGGRNMVSVKN
ncbi:MAG: GGDEF domain-containing protein [Bdellovibrionaceae bacterium]|jgi:two-component system, cell cycle response regulator|nr:GGDEF domain-containing protein [Pseudobdellovibrionaceae bacterium]